MHGGVAVDVFGGARISRGKFAFDAGARRLASGYQGQQHHRYRQMVLYTHTHTHIILKYPDTRTDTHTHRKQEIIPTSIHILTHIHRHITSLYRGSRFRVIKQAHTHTHTVLSDIANDSGNNCISEVSKLNGCMQQRGRSPASMFTPLRSAAAAPPVLRHVVICSAVTNHYLHAATIPAHAGRRAAPCSHQSPLTCEPCVERRAVFFFLLLEQLMWDTWGEPGLLPRMTPVLVSSCQVEKV